MLTRSAPLSLALSSAKQLHTKRGCTWHLGTLSGRASFSFRWFPHEIAVRANPYLLGRGSLYHKWLKPKVLPVLLDSSSNSWRTSLRWKGSFIQRNFILKKLTNRIEREREDRRRMLSRELVIFAHFLVKEISGLWGNIMWIPFGSVGGS